MKKSSKALGDALTKLTSLWPVDGELLAAMAPVEFIKRCHDEIENLRANVEKADARIAELESLTDDLIKLNNEHVATIEHAKGGE